MTDYEANERANKIVTIFLDHGHRPTMMAAEWRRQFTQEVSRELQRVAEECEWQKEENQRLEKFQQELLSTALDVAFKYFSTAELSWLVSYFSQKQLNWNLKTPGAGSARRILLDGTREDL